MATTMPPDGLIRLVTDRDAIELADLVTGAAGRPCRTADPEEWFPPEPHYSARASYEARAHALCLFCPVQLACLELALRIEAGGRGEGIWGGMAPWQRHALAQRRSQQLAGASGGDR